MKRKVEEEEEEEERRRRKKKELTLMLVPLDCHHHQCLNMLLHLLSLRSCRLEMFAHMHVHAQQTSGQHYTHVPAKKN